MIFVTIGLMYGFDRLIKEMDQIASGIDEPVIMQIGFTKYDPKYVKYFRFISEELMDQMYENSRLVVCHAGVGSILNALKHHKKVIAVPRKKEYGEAIENHQLEFAKELNNEGKIIAVYDVKNLKNLLIYKSSGSDVKIESDKRLVKALKKYLYDIDI